MTYRRVCAFLLAVWAALVPLALAACGGNTSATSTARVAATALSGRAVSPPQIAPNLNIQGIPQRQPDRNVGSNTDGWVLDRIEESRTGTFTMLTIRFVPPKDETAVPQTDGWYEESSGTYILEIQGVRGTNVVLRPNEVQPLSSPPLTGYYARRVMDDGILALAITSQGAQKANWSLSSGITPGIIRFSVDFK